MCMWKKCPDAEIAERYAERAQLGLDELRQAVQDHRRGVLDDSDLYAIIDRDRLPSPMRTVAA